MAATISCLRDGSGRSLARGRPRSDILNVQYFNTASESTRRLPLLGLHPDPAVDPEDLPGDPGRVVRDEKHGGSPDVGQLAGAAERDGADHRVPVEAEQPLPHVRAHETRGDAV